MPKTNLLKNPITDSVAIQKLLPHREPMLMVDSLLYFDDMTAVATLTIEASNLFVEYGKFTEMGLIEHMAQTAALMTGYKYARLDAPIREGFIASIKNLKIETLPLVKETVTTEAIITFEMADMTMVALTSKRQNELLASAEMTLVLKKI